MSELSVGQTWVWECPGHRAAVHQTRIGADFFGRPSAWFRCSATPAGCFWTWVDLQTFARAGRPPILLRVAEPGEDLSAFGDGNYVPKQALEKEPEEPEAKTLFDFERPIPEE